MTSPSPVAEIVGDPVAHLRSPKVMAFFIDQAGIDARYDVRQVGRADFEAYLAERRSVPGWVGCNVAAPLKLDAILLADQVTDRAAAAGAANILVNKQGELVAGNSDVGAMLAVLAPLLSKAASRGVTVLGDGGAARSALVALKMLGAIPVVRLQSRDHAAALKLSVEFGLDHAPAPFTLPIGSSGLINATPMGRADHPDVALDIDAMPADGWVVDLVAEGHDTPLLEAAHKRGLLAVDGTTVLVEQCAASFELLFGSAPPRAHDSDLCAMLRA